MSSFLLCLFCFFIFFFFFQAEDGIRDATVTGVQTCALPISNPTCQACDSTQNPTVAEKSISRSEERRVGKGVDLGGRRIIKKKKKRKKRKGTNRCRRKRENKRRNKKKHDDKHMRR